MNREQYQALHEIVFRGDYPGYKPEVREIPNGDGKVDSEKRYAHIANKYLSAAHALPNWQWARLKHALNDAHKLALDVADALQVPQALRPRMEFGALRVLEYPAGATSSLHTDFDLFTLMIYRDQPECFVAKDRHYTDASRQLGKRTPEQHMRLHEARKLNAQLHIGELGELIGLGPATPHEVIASDRPQHSIVYFAIPDHAAVLRTGRTVGEWLAERMSRSRTISVAHSQPSPVP